jgi:tellurite resistance-related uncharacterized protein
VSVDIPPSFFAGELYFFEDVYRNIFDAHHHFSFLFFFKTAKAGTWGRIVVAHGQLQYKIEEGHHAGRFVLNEHVAGVIEPQVHHSVSPIISDDDDDDDDDDVSFVVEFYRHPGTGAVDEKREGL